VVGVVLNSVIKLFLRVHNDAFSEKLSEALLNIAFLIVMNNESVIKTKKSYLSVLLLKSTSKHTKKTLMEWLCLS
jgi:hypothetical protein